MDALVLAAGMGSRLREAEACKPLTMLHGRSLLDIAICQLARAGAGRVVVATGYKAEQVEAALPDIAARSGIAVESRRVENYKQPNGYSVLAGAAGLDGEFLLVMADHVFSAAILASLMEAPPPPGGVTLAIDRRVRSPLVDPDDATWVELGRGQRIARIGKVIPSYDAVDCGAFRASPALPEAIRAAIGAGMAGSLSDGMQYLANQGRAATIDIGDAWWIDVDDVRALDIARAQAPRFLPELFKPVDAVIA